MSRKRSFWTTLVLLIGVFFIQAATAVADAVEQRLAELPAHVKERTREMIRAGIDTEDAFQLIQSMHANRFEAEQMLKAQSIVLEAQVTGLPSRPVINRALEGVAKQVPPERTLQAMETVRSRYAFAYGQARLLVDQKDDGARLGNMLAESLAAGFHEEDASHMVSRLQEHSPQLSKDQLNQLAAACLAMLRDMSRLGVSSNLSAQVISEAISMGFSTNDIASMHQSMLAQAQTHSAQSVAQGFAQAMQQGQASHGMSSPGQSGASGSGKSRRYERVRWNRRRRRLRRAWRSRRRGAWRLRRRRQPLITSRPSW